MANRRKWIKVAFVTLGAILVLVLATLLFLQTSAGKSFVARRLEAYLSKKLETEVTLGTLDYSIPDWIELRGLELKDKNNNVLLSGKQVRVDIHMFRLLRGDIQIEEIILAGVNVNIYRNQNDLNFNYQFIIDAFTSQTKDTASNKEPLKISISKLNLDSIQFRYNDGKEKMYYAADIGNFEAAMKSLDLDRMNFELKDWYLSHTRVSITDSSTHIKETTTNTGETSPFTVNGKSLALRDVSFEYKSIADGSSIVTKVDSLALITPSFNLVAQTAKANTIRLIGSGYEMQTVSPPAQNADSNTTASKPWTISVDSLQLAGNNFGYHNNFYKPVSKGLDYNHINVNDIQANAHSIRYINNQLRTNLQNASLVFNEQVQLKNAAAVVDFSDSLLVLKDALVAVNQSQLNARGEFRLPLNQPKGADLSKFPIRLHLDKSFVSLQDVELIAPGTVQKLPVQLAKNEKIYFAGNLDGAIDRLRFRALNIYTGNRQFFFRGDGSLVSATDPARLKYDFDIAAFHAERSLLTPALEKQLKDKNVDLPPAINAKGGVRGSTNDVALQNFLISTNYGAAQLNGTMNNFSNPERLNYNITVDARELETGKWIGKDSLLGKLTGIVSVKGKGTKPEQLVAELQLAVKSFVVKGYDYSNIDLTGSYTNGAFQTNGSINDKNLSTRIDLNGNLEQNNQSASGKIEIANADLYQLKLASDSFRISTTIDLDAKDLRAGTLNAAILIDSTNLFVTGKKIFIDTVQVNGQGRSDSTFITVATPFLVATLNGKYRYDELPAQVNHYIQTNYFDKKDTVAIRPTQAVFEARLTSHDFLTYLNPDLLLEKPVQVTASFDNRGNDSVLNALITASAFKFKQTGAEEVKITAAGSDTTLTFLVRADRLFSGSQNYLQPTVEGSFKKNMLDVAASTKDNNNKDFYALKSNILLEEGKTTISLTDNLLLNGESWQVADNNSAIISKEGYIFNNIVISRGAQSLSVNNKTAGQVSAIDIKIDSFSLASIVAFANQDSLLADGKMDGQFTVEQPIKEVPEVKGQLSVQALKVKSILIGDAQFNSSVANNQVQLTGEIKDPNEINIKANADINTGTLDADIRLAKLNMNTVEAFSGGTINRASGDITGFANIGGTFKKPTWKGELNFNDAAFALTDYNSLYRIKQEKIVFEYPTIKLDQFQITDTLNNPLTLNGTAKMLDNGSFDLDLSVRARNFIAINAPRKSESVIYGTGIMDANVTIEGNSSAPSIQGSASLENGSNVHYVIPQQNNYLDDRNDIVTFIKADTIQHLGTKKVSLNTDSVGATVFRGLKYNLNLQVKKEAVLTVVVDPLNNDELQIQGTAQINAGIDEGGRVGLNGVYNLESGYYIMNYKLIKRKFELVKGSTITFSGDPKEASADITAQYEVNASAGDLLGNEIADGAGASQSLTNKVPFLVILSIKGSLTKPELGFDIKLKEGAEGVNATVADAIENKLAQVRYDVSAMNKQVFGLLIMNRFISDRSSDFFAGGGFNADAVARESVSRFLAEAVNQIAKDLIKGVDIDVNLKNYQAAESNSITRTDVDVALSKRLFNDRLSISVGKNFTVDGNSPAAQGQSNNQAQNFPDITTTYKLSRDGRYMIRAYRRNQYEAQVDGYFVETGATFSITMDYNRFRELFQKRRTGSERREKRSSGQTKTNTK